VCSPCAMPLSSPTWLRGQATSTSTWTEELRGERRLVRIRGLQVTEEAEQSSSNGAVAQTPPSAAQSSLFSSPSAALPFLREFFLPPGFPYTVSGS